MTDQVVMPPASLSDAAAISPGPIDGEQHHEPRAADAAGQPAAYEMPGPPRHLSLSPAIR